MNGASPPSNERGRARLRDRMQSGDSADQARRLEATANASAACTQSIAARWRNSTPSETTLRFHGESASTHAVPRVARAAQQRSRSTTISCAMTAGRRARQGHANYIARIKDVRAISARTSRKCDRAIATFVLPAEIIPGHRRGDRGRQYAKPEKSPVRDPFAISRQARLMRTAANRRGRPRREGARSSRPMGSSRPSSTRITKRKHARRSGRGAAGRPRLRGPVRYGTRCGAKRSKHEKGLAEVAHPRRMEAIIREVGFKGSSPTS